MSAVHWSAYGTFARYLRGKQEKRCSPAWILCFDYPSRIILPISHRKNSKFCFREYRALRVEFRRDFIRMLRAEHFMQRFQVQYPFPVSSVCVWYFMNLQCQNIRMNSRLLAEISKRGTFCRKTTSFHSSHNKYEWNITFEISCNCVVNVNIPNKTNPYQKQKQE